MHISDLAATCYEAAGAAYPAGETFSILGNGGGEPAERLERSEWTIQPVQGISQLAVLTGEREHMREAVFDGFGEETNWLQDGEVVQADRGFSPYSYLALCMQQGWEHPIALA